MLLRQCVSALGSSPSRLEPLCHTYQGARHVNEAIFHHSDRTYCQLKTNWFQSVPYGAELTRWFLFEFLTYKLGIIVNVWRCYILSRANSWILYSVTHIYFLSWLIGQKNDNWQRITKSNSYNAHDYNKCHLFNVK